jgi:tetratricopeptide (TPR) repeat protein
MPVSSRTRKWLGAAGIGVGGLLCFLVWWNFTLPWVNKQSDKSKARDVYNKGVDLMKVGNDDEALLSFDEAIRLNPELSVAYTNRGTIHARKGNNERAFADLTEALRLDPNDAIAARHLTLVEARKPKTENKAGGLRIPEALEKQYPELIDLIRRTDTMNDAERQMWIDNLPHITAKQIADLRKTLIPIPDEEIELTPATFFAFCQQADKFMAAGEHEKAIATYTKVIKADKKLSFGGTPSYLRGLAYQKKGDLENALADFDAAIRTATEQIKNKPEDASAVDCQTYAYEERTGIYNQLVEKKEFDKAKTLLDGTIKLDANDAQAYLLRAFVNRRQGNLALAVADYTKVIDFGDKARPIFVGQAHEGRGLVFRGQGNRSRELNEYKMAIKFRPSAPSLHNSIAWVMATCNDEKVRNGKEAIEYAKKACELTKWKDPFYMDTLAAAYAEAGQFAESVEWQEKALAHDDFSKRVSGEELEKANKRLGLYKDGKPYREP